MDSADNTRALPQPSGFHEAVFLDTATDPADTLMVLIPDFSADQPFGDPDGVVWSPMGGALPQAGDRALVAESTDGSWWVLSWWSDAQSTGVADSTITALDGRLDALEVPETPTAVGSFAHSWVNLDTDRPARYYKASGRVHLEGIIASGTVGQSAFVLPSGYRHNRAMPLTFPAVSNNAFGAVYVYSDGTVTPAVGSNAFFDLSAISFRHS